MKLVTKFVSPWRQSWVVMPFGNKFRNRNEITRLPLCLLQFLLIFVQTIFFFFLPFIKIPSQSTNINTEHTFSVPTLLFPRTGRCQKWRRKKEWSHHNSRPEGMRRRLTWRTRRRRRGSVSRRLQGDGRGRICWREGLWLWGDWLWYFLCLLSLSWPVTGMVIGKILINTKSSGKNFIFDFSLFRFSSIVWFDQILIFFFFCFCRYVLAIAILSTLYTLGQVLRHVHELSTGRQMMQKRTSALIDFFGDQVWVFALQFNSIALSCCFYLKKKKINGFDALISKLTHFL